MLCWLLGWMLRLWAWRRPARYHGRRKPAVSPESHRGWNKRKPEEVRIRVIRIAAMGPELSCRDVAEAYNRGNRYQDITVSKTWVNDFIRACQYEIKVRREEVRRRRPGPGPVNRLWGIDLIGKTDESGRLHFILGALDHGARACVALRGLKDKTTIAILRVLLDAMEVYGKPKIIRTDNERVFTSRLFRFALWLLGIEHQRIDLACPWQNGRIERFFGTLKGKLNRWSVKDLDQLNTALHLFRVWYNHVRPHQHLRGMTPAEAWAGVDIQRTPCKEAVWFNAWDGLLTGYYIRR